jgi:hypothetical protein
MSNHYSSAYPHSGRVGVSLRGVDEKARFVKNDPVEIGVTLEEEAAGERIALLVIDDLETSSATGLSRRDDRCIMLTRD